MRKPKVAFVVNHAAFFVSHRLVIALHARDAGYEVILLTGRPSSATLEPLAEAALRNERIEHRRVAFRSAGMNPLAELKGLAQLVLCLRRERPDLVHCASPKGLLYGGIAARLAGIPALVLAVSGMGFAETSGGHLSLLRSLVRFGYRRMVRFAYRHGNLRVIVQNRDDREVLVRQGLLPADRITTIRGSGVRLSDFVDSRMEKRPLVVLPGRMLRDKGVIEFVEAVRLIRDELPEWRFVLAGVADSDNPTGISPRQLELWQAEGLVEWRGHVPDMPALLAEASIVCLPSYREGMPKALLEAAAAGCAVITTDAVGCREAIEPGKTGDLVPVGDSRALASALLHLCLDSARRQSYGREGRRLAMNEFDDAAVAAKTLLIYRELLADAMQSSRRNGISHHGSSPTRDVSDRSVY